jgi:hypothetical protein
MICRSLTIIQAPVFPSAKDPACQFPLCPLEPGVCDWYTLDGFDSRSDELAFALWNATGGDLPISHLDAGQNISVWYMQDLHDASELNNEGTVCMDVFANVTDGPAECNR